MQCSTTRAVSPASSVPVGRQRPFDGLKPNTPFSDAGTRSDPPASLPWAIGTTPAATSAADPPDDPPADNPCPQGLSVGPRSALSVLPSSPNSELVVDQRTRSPASRRAAV